MAQMKRLDALFTKQSEKWIIYNKKIRLGCQKTSPKNLTIVTVFPDTLHCTASQSYSTLYS